MKTIYKYEIVWHKMKGDYLEISMPENSKIIHAGLDPNSTPCFWAEVQTEEKLVIERVYILGTGNPFPALQFGHLNHVGSFIERCFVWHVYV